MPTPPDHRLTLRLKPEEYAVLKAKAGNRPLSTFVRELVLDKAAGRRTVSKAAPIKDHKALAQTLALLGQHTLVRSFKQVQRGVDDGTLPEDEETRVLLCACHDLLASVHDLLMRALRVAKQ